MNKPKAARESASESASEPTEVLVELLVSGLLATGWREIHEASFYARHREFAKRTQIQRAWVTKGGTLRVGLTCDNSFVVGSPTKRTTIYNAVVLAGSAALAENGHSGFDVLLSSFVELHKCSKPNKPKTKSLT